MVTKFYYRTSRIIKQKLEIRMIKKTPKSGIYILDPEL
jgi:hypothetical protein